MTANFNDYMKNFALFLSLLVIHPMVACVNEEPAYEIPVPDFDLPEMKWTSHDWEISKTTVEGRFELASLLPAGATLEVKCFFGENEAELKQISYRMADKWNYKYITERMTGLEAGKAYILKVVYSSKEARGGGQTKELVKNVRTMSDYSSLAVDKTVKPVAHRIEWETDYETPNGLIQISPDGNKYFAAYPRLVHLDGGKVGVFYHSGYAGGNAFETIYFQTTSDDGATWTDPVEVLSIRWDKYSEQYGRFINPEITRLQNGSYLFSVTAIGVDDTNETDHTLAMVSKDNCQTWSEPVIVGSGRSWEPMVVQLPNGELELLVSSEAQWWGVTNPMPQEILCARSTDNGETWTKYIRAAYSEGRRDGMPSAVVMQGNKGVLFSIETMSDNGLGTPSFVRRDLDGEWDPKPLISGNSDYRWRVEMAKDNGQTNGAAPYTIQLKTGEIVIMSQVNGKSYNGGYIWQTAYPRVVVCDNTGHGWSDATKTTPVGDMKSAEGTLEGFYYGCLFQKSDDEIWLAASHVHYDGAVAKWSKIKLLKGRILAE